MRLVTALLALLLLAACAEVDVGIPDPMTTGQLVVAYDAETQGVALLPNQCREIPDFTEEILQGIEGVEARAYYGLEPGPYCLEWGFRFSEGVLFNHNLNLSVEAGSLDFVSVVEAPIAE